MPSVQILLPEAGEGQAVGKAGEEILRLAACPVSGLRRLEGRYVPLKETIKGFQAILGGEVDDLPEQAFLLCGSLDEVIAKRGSF